MIFSRGVVVLALAITGASAFSPSARSSPAQVSLTNLCRLTHLVSVKFCRIEFSVRSITRRHAKKIPNWIWELFSKADTVSVDIIVYVFIHHGRIKRHITLSTPSCLVKTTSVRRLRELNAVKKQILIDCQNEEETNLPSHIASKGQRIPKIRYTLPLDVVCQN